MTNRTILPIIAYDQVSSSMENGSHCYCFQPLRYLEPNGQRIGLIILNQDLNVSTPHFEALWQNSAITGVADGGINRLHSRFNNTQGSPTFIPDYVSGDFDSAEKVLLDFYLAVGTEIIPTPDQDRTDFRKCLEIMLSKSRTLDVDITAIVILAGLGGRFDHEMANINTVLVNDTDIPLYLHDQESLTFPLRKGRNKLDLSGSFRSSWCGLIPYERVSVKTKGLKWNLSGTVMEFGGLISTSNKVVRDVVEIETDEKLIWTMGWKEKDNGNR